MIYVARKLGMKPDTTELKPARKWEYLPAIKSGRVLVDELGEAVVPTGLLNVNDDDVKAYVRNHLADGPRRLIYSLYQVWIANGGQPGPLKGRNHIARGYISNRSKKGRATAQDLIDAGVAHEEIYDGHSGGYSSKHTYFPSDFLDIIEAQGVILQRNTF
jgi:hypothetical protein